MAKDKKAVADHILLDAAGTVVDAIEKATTARYVQKATGKSVDWPAPNGMTAGTEAAMVWLFGAKTIMTNTASTVRNGDAAGSPEDEMSAITDRIAAIRGGKFLSEKGPKYDAEAASTAFCNVNIDNGSLKKKDYDATRAKVLAKMAAEPDWLRAVMVADGIETEYRKVLGRTVKSASDLLATL